MQQNAGTYSITAQRFAFGVSRGGYYGRRRRLQNPSQRQMERERLDQLAKETFDIRRGRRGAVGLIFDLKGQSRKYNRKTMAKSMNKQGLVAKVARKFKATTDSDHGRPVAPNLLAQDVSATAPNQKWVCDITYLWNGEGWLYLAV